MLTTTHHKQNPCQTDKSLFVVRPASAMAFICRILGCTKPTEDDVVVRVRRSVRDCLQASTPERQPAPLAKEKGCTGEDSKSPELPRSWQLMAQLSDVDIEVVREEGALDDELSLAAGGVTFGEAWRSFKQQEEVGFGKLRDYVSDNYVGLLRKMLSPPREHFHLSALGPVSFEFRGRTIRRDDFTVMNERGWDLGCSLWTDDKRRDRRYCIVYVHDIGGSRLAALSSLGVALDSGVAGYCAFDLTACGRSGGVHVSFGAYERYDVACVVRDLVANRGFTDVVLWGRGAGAVAALRYAAVPGRLAKSPTHNKGLYESVFGAGAGASSAYPTRKSFRVDILSVKARPKRARHDNEPAEARLDAVRRFVADLEVEPLTWQWVVSKPPLVVTKATGVAFEAGVREGDHIAAVGSSMRLPHTRDELIKLALALASRQRTDLLLHLTREAPLLKQERARLGNFHQPAGLILDCVVDSPHALVDALRATAADREPILVSLLDPLLSSALDLLFHSIAKRANFDPSTITSRHAAAVLDDVPALFAVNDFFDLDRGIPNLANLSRTVYDSYAAPSKQIVRYNAPLRLALRGTLDAMSSKFLNKSLDFLQGLPGFAQQTSQPAGPLPRWVVTTRPWSQTETEQTINDYESAQSTVDSM